LEEEQKGKRDSQFAYRKSSTLFRRLSFRRLLEFFSRKEYRDSKKKKKVLCSEIAPKLSLAEQ
jgi:hypothetical protein